MRYFSIKRPLEYPSEWEPGCKLLRKLSQEKKSPEGLSQLIFIPVIQIHITEIYVVFNWKLWKREKARILSKCLSVHNTKTLLT